MVETLKIAEAVKRRKGGHKSKLTVEEMLLLTEEAHLKGVSRR